MMKRKSVKMTVILTSLLAMLAGFLPMLGLCNVSPASAETSENYYYSDMEAKVAKLPADDRENLYIITSESAEPFKVTMYPYMNRFSGWRYLTVQTFYEIEEAVRNPLNRMYYNYYVQQGLQTSVYYLQKNLRMNQSNGMICAKNKLERGEAGQVPNLGRSYCASDALFIDQNLYSDRSMVVSYTNMNRISYESFTQNPTDDSENDFDLTYGYKLSFTEEQMKVPLYTPYTTDWAGYVPFRDIYDGIAAVPDKTQYLYFGYEKPIYTVAFQYLDDVGNWTSTAKQYLDGSLDLEVPQLPQAPYATFLGWDYPLSATVNRSVTYKALYSYEKFLVKFQNRDGTINATRNISYYEKFPALMLSDYVVETEKTRDTYGFVAWTAVKDDETTKIDPGRYHVVGETTVYPLFELKKSVNIETGEIEFDKDEKPKPGCGSSCDGNLFGALEEWNQSVKNDIPVPILNDFIYYLLWVGEVLLMIACIPLLVKLAMLLIKGIKSLVVWIQGMVAKNRRR